MPDFQLTQPPIAKAEMLIRKPVSEVFAAFVDPAITSKFWFTKDSAKLESGAHVQWDWEMYGVSAEVHVLAIEQDKRILIEWPGYDAPTTVEWMFTPHEADTTFVSITNAGFSGDSDVVVPQAIEATEAFTLVLAGFKALLEHDIRLNLVADRFPAGLAGH
ncbi:MAG: SRPBCC domain-containing protein [Chloroflexia bacterium]|nr:SRPBCC domain-containing protein [Chloroflexia bacterium]